MEITIHLDLITLLIGTLIGLLIGVFFRRWYKNKSKNPVIINQELPIELTPKLRTLSAPNNKLRAKQKYQSSNLKKEEKAQLLSKLISYMEEEKIYEQPNLTLAKLAKNLDLPKHQLSQIINEKIGCNFLEFINSYRVQAATNQLQNTDLQDVNVAEIGKKVGFNSKSTFYTAFKKYTHKTPSEYRKHIA